MPTSGVLLDIASLTPTFHILNASFFLDALAGTVNITFRLNESSEHTYH